MRALRADEHYRQTEDPHTREQCPDVEADGTTDVAFSHQRSNRVHSPRYIVDMVKYMRERFDIGIERPAHACQPQPP